MESIDFAVSGTKQKRIEWLKARRNHIGAADLPIILGKSPFKTRYELLKEKISTDEPVDEPNFAQIRGTELEPYAREWYEGLRGIKFPPMQFKHPDVQHFTCSMDGYNVDAKVGIEIKCPGKDDHQTAMDGKVPEKYIDQIYWQYIVTGAIRIDYVSYTKESKVILPVDPPSEQRKQELIQAAGEFYHLMVTKKLPPPSEKDTIEDNSIEMRSMAAKYHSLKTLLDTTELQISELRKKMIESLKHPKSRIGSLLITKTVKKGNVDYSKVPQLHGVNLDDYRKPDIESYTFTIDKK